MSEVFLGQILLVPFNFAPANFALCNGQVLSISQHAALFSLLGTMYGGNGVSTFQLPDLQGRVPLGSGQGNGLTARVQGQAIGSEVITLTQAEMPAHTHVLTTPLTATPRCNGSPGNQLTPVGNVPAVESAGVTATYSSAAPDASMSSGVVALAGGATAAITGGNMPHDNRQPVLAMNYCIALNGIFPSRN
jgi:microcystin-dependent protein